MLRPLQDMLPLDNPREVLVSGLAAAVGMIAQHFAGLVDVTMVATGLIWALDTAGGMTRAAVFGFTRGTEREGVRYYRWQGAFKAMDWARVIEGVGKLAAIGMTVALFGLLETVLISNYGGTIPMVVPIMFAAIVVLAWSVADQVYDLWPMLGRGVRKMMDRIAPKGDD